METIFISYRRSDSLDVVRFLAKSLRDYFGEDQVFLDEASALPGQQWPDRIGAALSLSQVALIIMGRHWLAAHENSSGRRRIDLEEDWVRRELMMALKRRSQGERFNLIPVLIDETQMPDADQLDRELSPITSYQAVRIGSAGRVHDFDDLKDRLVQLGLMPRVLPPVNTPRVGMVPQQLTQGEERSFLAALVSWEIINTPELGAPGGFKRELHRTYEFKTFEGAFEFMCEVKRRAIDRWDHHPRWQNSYNRIDVWLTTHNLNHRPSRKDVRLAREFEKTWREFDEGRR